MRWWECVFFFCMYACGFAVQKLKFSTRWEWSEGNVNEKILLADIYKINYSSLSFNILFILFEQLLLSTIIAREQWVGVAKKNRPADFVLYTKEKRKKLMNKWMNDNGNIYWHCRNIMWILCTK